MNSNAGWAERISRRMVYKDVSEFLHQKVKERKMFHQEQESALMRGLKSLTKTTGVRSI
jgi:hypothetical protein